VITEDSDLATMRCVPCEGGIPPLGNVQACALLPRLSPGWQVVEGHHLYRELSFATHRAAVAFVNRASQVAEEQGHHPALLLTWGRVDITIWTHAIDGLSTNDFILAARLDQVA
jgi:4a-hydroxytetrahydrobiopterin dehydratase